MNVRKIILTILIIVFAGGGFYYFFRAPQITNYPSKGADIIAFGDSLVQGIGSTRENDFVSLLSQKIGLPIINLGHAGDTTAQGLLRINELDAYNPKVVILLLGGNDHLRKVPEDITRENLRKIIESIHARGAVVLLLGVRGGLFTDRFETMFEDLRDEYRTEYVSDVLGGLFGNSKYMSDTIHPNDSGYSIIAERVYPVLSPLLK